MTATTIRVQMAQRKDTAANWTAANPILLSGEIGYETDTKKFKIGNGSTNWNSLAYLPIPDGSGNLTITGNLEIGSTGSLTFEGSTADGFETTLAVTNPTVDRTITLPDRSGTVITSGDTGTVTSTMILDGTIVNDDVNASAAIAGTKISPDFGSQTVQTTGIFSHALGSAAAPTVTFAGDTNTGIYSPGADQLAISTGGSSRLFVDASGRVGIGIEAPGRKLTASADASVDTAIQTITSVAGSYIQFTDSTASSYIGTNSGSIVFLNPTTERARIDSSGRLGVGTSSPQGKLHVKDGYLGVEYNSGGLYPAYNTYFGAFGTNFSSGGSEFDIWNTVGGGFAFRKQTAASTQSCLMYISSAGNVGIGTTSPGAKLHVQEDQAAYSYFDFYNITAGGGIVWRQIVRNIANTGTTSVDFVKYLGSGFAISNNDTNSANFTAFNVGASERMRITSAGAILIAKTADDINTQGIRLSQFGVGSFCRDAEIPLFVNRNTDDGGLIVFRQDGVDEGSISVSGTTVSYNGAHLSRWSQLPSGAERTEILRGTVLSNIDEMCEWGDEGNEQLNRMKVSDVEGDKNVSGVFQGWDDDDDTYTNDFYCAMTGDFIIRISPGVTVERGDLLMSAGDGTAKPQDDDIIRSKTIAKVTSTNVSCTYPDGSHCVPCVLMAC